MEEIRIEHSKGKTLLLIIGSLLFIALGVWLMLDAEHFKRDNPEVIQLTGLTSVLFFGVTFLLGCRMFFDNRPGLVLNPEGIHIDQSPPVSWRLVTELEIIEVHNTQLLMIHVSNPEAVISKAGGLRKLAMRANLKFYGAPVGISSASLKCSFDEMVELVMQYMNSRQNF